MRFKWKCLVVLLVLLTGMSFAVRESTADSLYVRKVVSLVLDDSGSMDGDRWNYAVYALQNLAALLNPGDTLTVTPLSTQATESIDISDAGLKRSIQALQQMRCNGGGTPIEPVYVAYEHLMRQPSNEPTTEYWLIVLTDGAFSGFRQQKDLNGVFDDFLSRRAPNGTSPKIIYLNIGGQSPVKTDAERGLYAYSASSANEISSALSQVSDFVTGRRRFTKSDFRVVDDHTIQISSPGFPLANIILLQNAAAKLKDIQSDQGQRLVVTRSAETNQRLNHSTVMRSTISRIECPDGNIAAGVYTISFDQAFNLSDLTVLFEPAIEIHLICEQNGQQLDRSALSNMYVGETLEASYRICESRTNIDIPLSLISGAKAGISVTVGNDTQTGASGMTVELKKPSVTITAWLDIPGFRRLSDSVTITPRDHPPSAGVGHMDDMTMTLFEYRNIPPTVVVTNYIQYYDENGKEGKRVELSSRQEVLDQKITVETKLPYKQDKLYGNDGKLYLEFYDDGTVTVGTWAVSIYWGGELKSQFRIVIIPSTFTVDASPPSLTMSLSDFLAMPRAIKFTLIADGKWPASCEELQLEVTGDIPGTLTYDSAGNGIYTFSRKGGITWGDYHLTPSLKNDTLKQPKDVDIHLTRSDAKILLDPSAQSRRQSELNQPVTFTARMTVDGKAVPFESKRYSVTCDQALKDKVNAALQTDGTLLISLNPDLGTPVGTYTVTVEAEGGKGQATLEILGSSFEIKPDPKSLALVTDDLYDNQKSIRYEIAMDGRQLTKEEVQFLKPAIDEGLLPAGIIAYEPSAVIYTPHAPSDWVMLPDGTYPVTCALTDGTNATADVILTMIKYQVRPIQDGQSISRESLVNSKEAVIFEIWQENRQLTQQDILAIGVTASTDEKHKNWVELGVQVDADGKVHVTPSRTGWRGQASLAPLGEMPVTLTIKTTSGSARMHIRRGDFFEEWLPYRIVPVLILLWLLGMIFKKRFRYTQTLSVCSSGARSGNEVVLDAQNWFQYGHMVCWRMILPWIRDRKRIKKTDIVLQADRGHYLQFYIRPHDVSCRYYTVASDDIEKYESAKIGVDEFTEIDPPDLQEDEPAVRTKKRRSRHWRRLGAGTCLVRYDGYQYSFYYIK